MLMALVRLQPAYSARLVLDIETQTQGFHASSTAFLEVAEIIRVITAIFLSQTLEAASNDVDIMIQERMRKKSIFVERLEDAGCRVAKPPMTSTKISHLGTWHLKSFGSISRYFSSNRWKWRWSVVRRGNEARHLFRSSFGPLKHDLLVAFGGILLGDQTTLFQCGCQFIAMVYQMLPSILGTLNLWNAPLNLFEPFHFQVGMFSISYSSFCNLGIYLFETCVGPPGQDLACGERDRENGPTTYIVYSNSQGQSVCMGIIWPPSAIIRWFLMVHPLWISHRIAGSHPSISPPISTQVDKLAQVGF